MPNKVDYIVKALKREHPDWDEEKVWAVAYDTFKGSQAKGKETYADDDDVVVGHMSTSKKANMANDFTNGINSVSSKKEARDGWGRDDMRPEALVGNPKKKKKKAAVMSPGLTQYEGDNMDDIEKAYEEYLNVNEDDAARNRKLKELAKKHKEIWFKVRGKVFSFDTLSKLPLKDGVYPVNSLWVGDIKDIYSDRKMTKKIHTMTESVGWNETEYGFKDDIFHFLQDNPKPTDADVHAFADSLGVPYEELEAEMFALLADMAGNITNDTIVGSRGPMSQNFQLYTKTKVPSFPALGERIEHNMLTNAFASRLLYGTVNEAPGEKQGMAGFDKLSFGDSDELPLVKRKLNGVMQKHGLKGPQKSKTKTGSAVWRWENKSNGLIFDTAVNPLTGFHLSSNEKRPDLVGYAGYVGMEGPLKEVKALFKDIKNAADYEDAEFGERGYI